MKTQTDALGSNHRITAGNRNSCAEAAVQEIFALCASFAVLAVASITLYMILKGMPAVLEVGWKEILFSSVWEPTAPRPRYGVWYVMLTSVAGTGLAITISVPVGILTAVFLAEICDKRLALAVRPAVELLAGIPSVIYGLLGIYLLTPLMYKLELRLFAGSKTHQFTGGSNLLSAALVLAVMILPTVTNISETAIRSVSPHIREASLALGASRIQTVFKAVLPAARSGIAAAAVLGVGRAVGEAMAITLVSGGSVNLPLPFNSVRFLTTAIVSEMSYAEGTHRQMLFTVGLILFGFIMIIHSVVNKMLKRGMAEHE